MNDISYIAKMLIGVGAFIILMGLFMLLISKVSGLGRLPGDIYFRKGNFTFYFPLVTSILLSLVLTLVLNLFFRR
jgi:tellurite resistance protein TehA-like permease